LARDGDHLLSLWGLRIGAGSVAPALAALALVSLSSGFPGSRSVSAADTRAFVGARVIDGTGRPAIESAVLLVQGGKVAALAPAAGFDLPPGAERVDLTGHTVIPGLINTHGHVGETKGLRSGPETYDEANVRAQLALYARYGVTTVFSLGGDREAGFRVRDEGRRQDPSGARVFLAGPVIAASSPEEARARVDEVVAMKADLVKIRVDDNLGTAPKMSPEVYRAVIARAHERGLRVAAHIFYLDDAKGVLRAGADFIAHSVRDRLVDDELVGLLKERGICVCPTLMREVSTFVYEAEPAFFKDPFFLRDADPAVLQALREPQRQDSVKASASAQAYKLALQMAKWNLKELVDRGVPIAFGTDTGPPARFQGYFEHLELEEMASAGLTASQILASATRDAASCMQVAGTVGTLAPGARADFVVLEKDPLADIRNTRTIRSVWVGGQRLPR
jgi:imidazolonepropionase-like amidohydrolase